MSTNYRSKTMNIATSTLAITLIFSSPSFAASDRGWLLKGESVKAEVIEGCATYQESDKKRLDNSG